MRGKVVAGVETLRATSLPGGGRNKKSVCLQTEINIIDKNHKIT